VKPYVFQKVTLRKLEFGPGALTTGSAIPNLAFRPDRFSKNVGNVTNSWVQTERNSGLCKNLSGVAFEFGIAATGYTSLPDPEPLNSVQFEGNSFFLHRV
jgi:hypothetical protein